MAWAEFWLSGGPAAVDRFAAAAGRQLTGELPSRDYVHLIGLLEKVVRTNLMRYAYAKAHVDPDAPRRMSVLFARAR